MSVSLEHFSGIWLSAVVLMAPLDELVKPIAYWPRAPPYTTLFLSVAVRALTGWLATTVNGGEVAGWVSEVVERGMVQVLTGVVAVVSRSSLVWKCLRGGVERKRLQATGGDWRRWNELRRRGTRSGA